MTITLQCRGAGENKERNAAATHCRVAIFRVGRATPQFFARHDILR